MHSSTIRSAVFVAAVCGLYLSTVMLIPAMVDLYYDHDDWKVFGFSAFFIGGVSLAVAMATRGGAPAFSKRLGFLVVNLLWITLSLAGAVPLYMSSIGLSIPDAIFEATSAVTTTGSTVITGLDDLPPGILLWRSLLQWIGGIGIIGIGLFVLPNLHVGGFAFFKLESSDTNDRPFARFASFARALVIIYISLTILCAVMYGFAGMSQFDAINHALTTVSTAGFSTHDASFGHFESLPLLWITIVFMIVGALPFSILVVFLVRGRLDTLKDPQIIVFIGLLIAVGLAVSLYNRAVNGGDFATIVTHSFFNMTSILTTTGYASQDYTTWGPFVLTIVFFGMFVGGCSGSTTGGVKIYRFIIMFNTVRSGLRHLVYPNAINTVRYGGRTIEADTQRAVYLFASAFIILWVVGTLAMGLTGHDLITSVTASLSAIANIGPGLGEIIGPSGSYAPLDDAAKIILSTLMILGRLEVLTALVVMTPMFWRE